MHYNFTFLIMLLVNLSVVRAQITNNFYRVNFNVDEHVLDQADKLVLDKIAIDYQNCKYGELQLTAHTDADAANDYNMQLSRKRADAVTAYLITKGINTKRVSVKWFGENKPEKTNTNDEGKAINRRVDLTLKQVAFTNIGDLIKLAGPEYKQAYTIDPTKDNVIKGRNGTSIVIPKNSLVTKSGKPVEGSSIQIVLEEFLKPSDAAFNQLSTVSDGKLLQSGGMFSIKAFAQDEELVLQKGKQLQVEMPTINMQPGMELFTAVKNDDGIMEWKPTSVPFKPKGQKDRVMPFTKLDTKYLSSIKLPETEFDAGNISFTHNVPSFPKAPIKPRNKPELKEPNPQNYFAWYERWFVPGFILDKKLETEQTRRQAAYDKRMAAYNKKIDAYELAHQKYMVDSAAFELATLETFREWLREQRGEHIAYVHFLEIGLWNAALTNLISMSDNNNLTSTNPKAFFNSMLQPKGNQSANIFLHKNTIATIDFLLTQSMAKIVANHSKKGELNLDFRNRNYYSYGGWENSIASIQFNEHPKLELMLDAAQKDIFAQREKAGMIDQNIMSTVYNTSLSSFGTFNCDKYDGTPPNRMATLTIPYKGDARVSVFVPKTNSYIYAMPTNKGYTVKLPKGSDVKVVLVAFNEFDGPSLSIQKINIKENKMLQLEPKSVTLTELQGQLASL
jgi:hypothetical protein